MTGVLMSVFQLVFFPRFIKVVGIAAFQRLGFLVCIPAFLAVPFIKMLSWNYPTLFAASVVANSLALSSLWVVSDCHYSIAGKNKQRCSFSFLPSCFVGFTREVAKRRP